MKYELKRIDSLIKKYLLPNSPTGERVNMANTDTVITEINDEISRIKSSFEERMFQLENEKQVERYIHSHQSYLIRLCDRIVQQFSPCLPRKGPASNEIGFQQEHQRYLYSQLGGLLAYLDKYFGRYFNLDEDIPNTYRVMNQTEFREKMQELDYYKNCELIEIVLFPIKDFTLQKQKITFRKLGYYKEILKEIDKKCTKCNGDKNNCKLIGSLIYLNFNSFKFFSYITTILKKEIQDSNEIEEKIKKLSFLNKKLHQIPIKTNLAYKPEQEVIKEQFSNWLFEETTHWEKVFQLSNGNVHDQNYTIDSNFRLITGMSVPQVAYLIRLMVDTGLILNKNHKELLSFFANHIKTKKADTISPSSFNNKFYMIDPGTKEDLKERVIKLLNQIQKQN